MNVNLQQIFDIAIAIISFVVIWAQRLSKILSPIIEEVEKAAQDGKIDKSERKQIVLHAIDLAIAKRQIKINFLEKIIIGKVVDYVAGRLPDFNVSGKTKELLADVDNRLR